MRFYKIIYRRYTDRIKNLYRMADYFIFETSKEEALKRFLKVNEEVRKYDIKEIMEIIP